MVKISPDAVNSKLAVLIFSCDNYSDIWGPFFDLFFRFWPDCPYRVYLVSNWKVFDNPRITTICIGNDQDWSSNALLALEKVAEPYALICMEDYLLTHPVSTQSIEEIHQYIAKEKIDCFRLLPVPGPTYGNFQVASYDTGIIEKGMNYSVSLQAAIWNIHLFRSLLIRGESAWELEMKGTIRSAKLDAVFAGLYPSNEKILPFTYFCTGVVKGYWVKEAVELCNSFNIPVDLSARPMEPLWVRWKRTISWVSSFIRWGKSAKKKLSF